LVNLLKEKRLVFLRGLGGGIAMNFLNAGLSVVMLEMKQEALDRGIATIPARDGLMRSNARK
jgi:3-hydroxyacyl-CoA dehydrogenase